MNKPTARELCDEPSAPNSAWEVVNDTTQRLPVPGGWLYQTWIESVAIDYYGQRTVTTSSINVTFVPRPEGWEP